VSDEVELGWLGGRLPAFEFARRRALGHGQTATRAIEASPELVQALTMDAEHSAYVAMEQLAANRRCLGCHKLLGPERKDNLCRTCRLRLKGTRE
jgi:hypothetical protein